MRLSITFLLILSCLCCENLLHEEEISIGKIESVGEMESAVDGLYSLLAFAIQDNSGFSFMAPNTKGDDITLGNVNYSTYYHGPEQVYCWKYSQHEYYQSSNWRNLYKIIASANNIILQFERDSELSNNMLELLGEAYFLRAYTNFRLTRTFGRIPLINNIDIDYNVQSASFEEIYLFIENDLQLAKKLLPETNNASRSPNNVPHIGTAKALLAEVYLSWAGYPLNDDAKYRLAANEAFGLIDSVDYYEYGLLSDFKELWEKQSNHNPEAVFKIDFNDPVLSKSNDIMYTGYAYQENSGIQLYPDSSSVVPYFFPVEVNFFNQYPNSYRKDLTFYTEIYVPNSYPFFPQIDTGYVHISTSDACSRLGYRKFYIEHSIVNYADINYIPDIPNARYLYIGNSKIYLLRYAQTLLTYAEASARSGNIMLAYENVNKIRRRANNVSIYSPSKFDLPTGLSLEAIVDSIVQERAWELAGEPEGRWFDLVRLEKVEQLQQIRHPEEGGFPAGAVTKDDYFFPIPDEELILNPNLSD